MIKKYKKKDGSTAYKLVAYLGVDPETKKQIRTTRQGFKTEREAKRVELELIEQYERQGGWKKVVNTTFGEIATLWFEQYQHTVKPSTYFNTEGYYNAQIKPVFGSLIINKISVLTCQKTVNRLSAFAAYGSYVSIINRIFKFAVNLGVINQNPMDKVIRAKCSHVPKSETVENFYTKTELLHFLDIVERTRDISELLFFRIAAYGGLRVGEILALENTDFDFKNSTISITKTVAWTKKGYIIQSPKTKKSKRTISMDNETMELAKKYIKSMPIPIRGTQHLYTFSPVSARNRLKKILSDNNLKPITLHGFRHTHASLLFEAGVPAKLTQERLGHSKISITLDLYTHLSKMQKDDIARKLSDYIAV